MTRFCLALLVMLASLACGDEGSDICSISPYMQGIKYEHLESGRITQELVFDHRNIVTATDKETGASNFGRFYPDPQWLFTSADLMDIYQSEPQSNVPTHRIDIVDRCGNPSSLSLDINTTNHDETRHMIEKMEAVYQVLLPDPPATLAE